MPVIETVVSTPTEQTNPVTVVEVVKPTNTDFPPTETQSQELAASEAKPEPEAKEPEVKKEPEDPKFAARFAALSRKEKELVAKEREVKEALLKAEAYRNAVKSAKSNPIKLLEAAGFKDFQEFASHIINQPDEEPAPDPYKTKVDKIAEEIEAYKQHQAQLAEAQKQAQLNQILQDVDQFITNNEDKYPATRAYNAINDVWGLIERVFIESKGQTRLTLDQAAGKVEEYYQSVAAEEEARLARLKKPTNKIETNPKTEPAALTVQHQVEREVVTKPTPIDSEWAVPPTLTNHTSIPQPNSSQRLTEEERMRRAIAKLRWTDD